MSSNLENIPAARGYSPHMEDEITPSWCVAAARLEGDVGDWDASIGEQDFVALPGEIRRGKVGRLPLLASSAANNQHFRVCSV